MFDQIFLEKTSGFQRIESRSRCLNFSGARNFRDLGGYHTVDGKMTKWGMLYRSDALHRLTDNDLRFLDALRLDRIIDFRAFHEKEREPDRIPSEMGILYIEIPIADASTRIWLASRREFVKKEKTLEPARYMIESNVELATRFTPEIRQFFHELLAAKSRPVLFHCAAGKDRTGFAAAVLLRVLGVSQQKVMEDYLLTNEYFLSPYQFGLAALRFFKGKSFANGVKGFMEARPEYLEAAFHAIDQEHGSFDTYVRNGLGLSESDVRHLHQIYLT